jgi:tryptophan 2,3-dioxygenase
LNIQQPKTDFPDEEIFIIYHQITELYFKLSLNELKQIANNGKKISPSGQDAGWNKSLNVEFFTERLKRINNYFEALTKSFSIMVNGMEKDQFLKFRMSLLPASGFQSAQYREIELACTQLINLTNKNFRDSLINSTIEEQIEHVYWKEGAIDLKTKSKTLMLQNFEKKYFSFFIEKATEFKEKNILSKFLSLKSIDQKNPQLIEQLRLLDLNVNVNWPLVHYKSAVRYLSSKEQDIEATGGTNWQKYLPPRFQKRIFFPNLWSSEEKENWGRQWVLKALKED